MSLQHRLNAMEKRIAALEQQQAQIVGVLEHEEVEAGPSMADVSSLDGPAVAHAERDQTQSLG